MNCKRLIVKASNIQGFGLFANETIKKGELVMLWNVSSNLIPKHKYDDLTLKQDPVIIKTGVRYINDYFMYTDNEDRMENYINHSFNPNILYHCGICFAIKNIQYNEELTVDYTYLLSENDPPVKDTVSGKLVSGISGLECLKQTTSRLNNILNIL